ncbi:low specificity L-threonine aldolase [Alsobacter sp. SYSU M60028]|uniref:L-threonine aldolase n=1 Tax=Alsobacter ponti TaxID=2962936 RepID=A0ABT1LE25_9HYPH|nr:low specificity L-threonine aldolase [Alsobacter ponti]MCP8939750.1 low specificity L-threonine aldolase [Alsobacter ponti]
MNFASDNVLGASPKVLQALLDANEGSEPAYGVDAHTRRAEEMLAEAFEHEVVVFLVATGTGANALALSALTPPWGAVFCHAESHVLDDECGAPEMFTDGAKLVGIEGAGGKFTPEGLAAALERYPRGVVKAVQPSAVSVSQVTEAGTLYSLAELDAIFAVAKPAGLRVHLDGARFANAMVALGCSAAEMSWKRGVDVVSFGATKNGCLACEAVVFFDKALAENFQYRRKRSGHTVSKGRLLGAQMVGYLSDGHWIDNARHANRMAATLAEGLAAAPGVRLAWPTQANEVFAVLPPAADRALKAAGFRGAPWSSGSLPPGFTIGPDEVFLRFVTSFATRPEHVAGLVEAVRAA